MGKVRLRFSKTGRAKFISHLDLMATLRRAFLRSGTELKYSAGFNPHPYISAALPLSVGCESVCELLDFEPLDEVDCDGLPGLVNRYLPEGIVISEAYASEEKFAKIAWLEAEGRLYYDAGAPRDASARLLERFDAESIIISKRTKSGVMEIDIAPHIKDLEFYADNGILMKARITARNPSLSPENLMNALTGEFAGLAPDFAIFRRLEFFDEKMDKFR